MAGVVEDTFPAHTKDHDESKVAFDGNSFLLSLIISSKVLFLLSFYM
jgi:hypothetical protein